MYEGPRVLFHSLIFVEKLIFYIVCRSAYLPRIHAPRRKLLRFAVRILAGCGEKMFDTSVEGAGQARMASESKAILIFRPPLERFDSVSLP